MVSSCLAGAQFDALGRDSSTIHSKSCACCRLCDQHDLLRGDARDSVLRPRQGAAVCEGSPGALPGVRVHHRARNVCFGPVQRMRRDAASATSQARHPRPHGGHARMKSRLRTIITRVLVFLLLGAIVNVAVAWGCAAWIGCPRREYRASFEPWVREVPTEWLPPRQIGYGSVPGRSGIYQTTAGFGMPGRVFEQYVKIGNCFWISVDQFGWPRLSLECEERTAVLPGDVRNITRLPLDIQIPGVAPSRGIFDRYLPLRPLWPGFAINTIFYAVILALLFYGPGRVRRFVRVRRGRCPACGFIIAPGTCANGLCSECGATLPRRVVNRAPVPASDARRH
jgi:hypothetical protein